MKDNSVCAILEALSEVIHRKDIRITYLELEVERLEKELKEAKSHE